jgi:hypothetical protein
MRTVVRLTIGVLAALAAASAASAEVHLTIQGGRVTLVAKDATVRQILAEWERVGRTKVINAERIAGGPLTLEMTNVPEQKALDMLLRSVSGVLLAPRAVAIDNLSAFERIIVMPPSAAPPPPATPPPASGQGAFQPPRAADDDQEERPNPGGGPQNRGPAFVFPQPQVVNPQAPNPPGALGGQTQQPTLVFPPQGVTGAPPPISAYPGVSPSATPAGVSVPGMVVPAPAAPPGQVVPAPAPMPGPGFPPPTRQGQ